jgi:hypothetical protein
MRLRGVKLPKLPYKRLGKGVAALAFIAAIGTVGYYAVEEAFYPNRVKVSIINSQTDKPIVGKKIVIREADCQPQPCEPEVLAEGRTDFFGNIRVTTKQLKDSFIIQVEGFSDDGPWLKRPGSLFFGRQYGDREFVSANLAQTDLTVKLQPAQ